MFHQSSQKVPVSDVIANALDALEREQKLPETIMEPSKTSRENLPYWPIIWPISSRKLIEAGINEKERLKSLWQLIDAKLEKIASPPSM